MKDEIDKALKDAPDITGLVRLLRDQTDEGKNIDPNDVTNQLDTWGYAIRSLYASGLSIQALDVAREYYDCLSQLQATHDKRYHKGAAAQFLGTNLLTIGERRAAEWFFTIAMIEDVTTANSDAVPASSCTIALRAHFGAPESFLQNVAASAYSNRMQDLSRYPESTIVHLARTQAFTLTTDMSDQSIPVSKPFLKKLSEQLDQGTNDEKKKSLEFLASYLMLTIPCSRIIPNAIAPDHEMDLVVVQTGGHQSYLLEALGRSFIVECKNWQETVGVRDINHFVAKIRFHGSYSGVLFAKNGISGAKTDPSQSLSDGKLTQLRWYQQDGIVLIILTREHIDEIAEGSISVSNCLLREYEAVRFNISSNNANT